LLQEFVVMDVNETAAVYPAFTRDRKWLGFGTPEAISKVEGSILWLEIWGHHSRAARCSRRLGTSSPTINAIRDRRLELVAASAAPSVSGPAPRKPNRMRIVRPTWYLLKPRCPCCHGQGELCFSACPECGHMVLICAEVGTVFGIDASTVIGDISDAEAVCPNCRRTTLSSFRNASRSGIQALGFTSGQYA